MKKLNRFPLMTCLALAVTGFGLGCDSDDDDDDKGGGGGLGLANKFFGGGDRAGGESGGESGGENGGGENGGGENGGGEVPGGGEGPGGGQGGSVDASSCQSACASIIQCFGVACELQISAADASAAVNECVPECQAEATPDDLQSLAQLTADNCAGFNQLAQSEGLCEDIGGDGFEEPGEGGGEGGFGGGGGGAGGGFPPPGGGDCSAFCATLNRCCGEDPECDPEAEGLDQCEAACDFFPPELIACVSNAGGSCQAIESQCAGEFGEGDFDEEGF